jgi:hypothetical protein
MDNFEYKLSQGLSIRQVHDAAATAWALLKTGKDPLLVESAAKHGISAALLPEDLRDVLSIGKSASGFDPSTIDLLIVLLGSSAAKKVGEDVWKYVFLPYLRRKFGDQALVEKKSQAKKGHEK